MFVWVNSQFNPSDINSKMCTDFTQSNLWLHGPPFFLDSLKIESKVWSNFNKGNFQKNSEFTYWNPSIYTNEKEKSCSKVEKDINDEVNKCLAVHKKLEIDTNINMTLVFNSKLNCKERIMQTPFIESDGINAKFWVPSSHPTKPMNAEFYTFLLSKYNSFHMIITLVTNLLKLAKYKANIDLSVVAFEKICLTSQSLHPPKRSKSYEYTEIKLDCSISQCFRQ